MDNYFTSFRLLTHVGVNNIRATSVLKKNRFSKCTVIGDKQLQKKEPKRFVRCWNKVEKDIFKNKNQISSIVTARIWVFSTEWTRTWPRLVSE